MIQISNLSKSFGDVHAVRDVSFQTKKGELFALLGLNGAGKSTTISILCGQLQRDGGQVIINGMDPAIDPDGIKRELGVVFQESALDKPLTARQNLRSRAALYGITGESFERRLDELVELLELDGLLDRAVGKLSGGQRRRIDIARALLHQPSLLVLDEPTTGLDPQTRHMLWEVISKLRREHGTTVFLTTHYMEEAADADHIVILDSGRIAAEGSPLELKNAYAMDYITLYGADEQSVRLLGLPCEAVRDAYRIRVPSTADATALILAHPSLFTDYEITKGKMDDVFLAVTGKSLVQDERVRGGARA